MKFISPAALILSSIVVPTNTLAAQNAPMSTCASLAFQWDNIEKNLGANLSRSLTENSAPRATLGKLEDLEQLAKAEMIYQMMKDQKCPLPTTPPSAATYVLAASTCDLERMRQRSSDIAECKRENWKKSGE
jgi:hypothetical protein